MIRALSAAAGLALLLAACGPGGQPTGNDEGPAATGFIQPGAEVPETVETRGGVPRDSYGRPFDYAFLGKRLPAFEGPLVSGGTYSSDALQGAWTVVDIWGIWCSDCMADAPYVHALARAIEMDPDLNFISIHTPPSATRADEAYGSYGSVAAYFEARGYSYPTVIDRDASLRNTLSITWTPTYLLVAPDGTVAGFRTDLSAAPGQPVKDFLAQISEVQRDWSP